MKLLMLFCGLLLSSSVLSQSQTELILAAEKAYIAKDKKLNEVYQKILGEYADDKTFIKNLKASERLWIKFRDTEMLMKYPEDSGVRDGTVFNLCYFNYKAKLTQERINTLHCMTSA